MTVPRFLGYGVPLVLDAAACALVIAGRGALGIGLHAVAAALGFLLTRLALRASGDRPAAIAAAVLVLALPAVGAAILAFVAWPSWSRQRGAGAGTVIEVPLPDGSTDIEEPPALELAPAARRPIRELLRCADSPAERVRAVMSLRHMDAKRAVPLLRQAFTHASEDVRLLAFGILEQREKRLRTRIERSESRLAGALGRDGVDGVQQHRRLARDHWELVYGGFVSGDLEPVVLRKATEHARRVLVQEADATMAVLLARIHLRQKQPEQAWAYLERADRAGFAPASSAPLFAEAAFQMRRFSAIPAILRAVPRAELRRAELEPVAEFWTSEA
jgi:hypothetical protein